VSSPEYGGARVVIARLALMSVCVLFMGADQAASPTEATRAIRAWLDGDAGAALAALARQPPSRERDFSQGVVLLYSGDAGAAEQVFRTLRARDALWLPAVRWLARAQKELGRPEAADTAVALLGLPGATSRDQLWAAGLFAERHDLQRAREALGRAVASESDLYLAWKDLADVEAALGHPEAARAARDKAEALYPGPAPALAPPPPLPAGSLRYRAKYMFIPFATLTLSDGGLVEWQGRPARRLTMEARSSGANFFFRIDSRLESFVAADGTLLGHHNTSNDSSSARHEATVDIDPATGAFRDRQVSAGLFLYEVLPLPPHARAHNGLSMIADARAAALARSSLFVLRIADSTWKGTLIRSARMERIQWQHREVDAVRVEIGITSRSTAGVQGTLQMWISADDRAIPYRARMAMSVGSVTLELMPGDAGEVSTRG
jgi:tetratricopeptide (TPR) repeat protein